ncbi:MAG TPA: carboxylating nicotinate-nucleotide diphosphorylase [Chitinophagaceae bacterium]|nr:carboxylating nicotinate-nucleotide diphosphorylase [Chitinophagaceae bacterium]
MDEVLYDAFIRTALEEDLGSGDHSTLACIDPALSGKARLLIKEDGVIAGIGLAERIFRFLEPSILLEAILHDGDRVHAGESAFIISAHIQTILKAERLVLNCMQRMSGIATLTRTYTEKLQGFHTRLLDTRKTTPNFRGAEKEAVRIAGGLNHRMGLYDMIMLKDNHIDWGGGIERVLDKTRRYLDSRGLSLKIEVEARNLEEVNRIVATGKADRILLDNFSVGEVALALKCIPPEMESEASGNINLDNIQQYASTGVDYISAGAIIHHAVSLDLSLKAEPDPR